MTKTMNDQDLISCFDKTEEYLKVRKELHALLREGYFALAQTKTALGAHNVTSLQYPRERIYTNTNFTIDSADLSMSVDRSHSSLDNNNNNDNANENEICTDPVQWFSAMPPQSLRSAQKLFTQSTFIHIHSICCHNH
jgi:hypothetical protein